MNEEMFILLILLLMCNVTPPIYMRGWSLQRCTGGRGGQIAGKQP